MIFTIDELKNKYLDYDNFYQKIVKETEKGNLIKIKRGLYSNSKDDNPFLIANNICFPSYISFETALSYYGLIPERVYTIKSASFKKNKVKNYKNDFGTFIYNDINKEAYPYEIDTIMIDGMKIFIATKEKALTDTISLVAPRNSIKEIKELIFNDLRINEEVFESLNKKIIIELCELYHNTSLKFFKKYLMKEISNDKLEPHTR